MKKFLCILLALTFVFSIFSACANNEEEPGESVQPSDSVQPSGEDQEPSDEPEDGEAKRVLGIWMTLSDTAWQMMDEMLGGMFEEGGYQYDSLSSEGDPVLQIEQVENAAVQGYDLIFLVAISGEAVADACQRAMDDGVFVYAFINNPINCNVYHTIDHATGGEMHVDTAAAWALEKWPDAGEGEINTVLIGQDFNDTNKTAWDAMLAAVEKYPQLNVVDAITIEESMAEGQSRAENILTMNPDIEINLWIVGTASGLLGVNAAVMAENSGVHDINNVGIIGNVLNDEVAGLLAESPTNGSAVRMCTVNGGRLENNLRSMYEECDMLLRGEHVDPESPAPIEVVTPETLAEFGY